MRLPLKCGECGHEIEPFEKYWEHETGAVLCDKCFQKNLKKGKIK